MLRRAILLVLGLVLGLATGVPALVAQGPPSPSKVAEAIAALEPLRGDPKAPPEKLALLGVLYLETGRPAEALAVLEPLARAPGANARVLLHAGRAALATGDETKGDDFLTRSVAAAPDSPARRELGLLRGGQGRNEEAYELLCPWCSEHQEDLEACRGAVALALRLDRLAEAEELLAKLPRERPGVRLLWVELLLRREDGPGALAMVEPLLAKHPPVMAADVTRVAADAYLRNGRPGDAVALLTGKAGQDPRLALLLGRAHFQTGDPERALGALAPFAAPLAASPSPAPGSGSGSGSELGLLLEYGRVLVTLGRAAEAVPVLIRLTEWDPAEAQGWQLLGQALAMSGRRAEAEAALAEFQRLARARDDAAEPRP